MGITVQAEIRQPEKPYSRTLKEQIDQIKNDPQVARFRAAREKLNRERLTPTYHFAAPENNVGDPNGFCFWNGNWHLFYQFRPDSPKTVYWGHAVSKDLIHWKDLPIALYPVAGQSVYSGSALVEKDRVLAIYHATGEGNQVVRSSDPLLMNWEKLPDYDSHGVSIPKSPSLNSEGFPYRVWDPFLYRDGGTYYSISGVFYGSGEKGDEALRIPVWHLFESKDLQQWDYSGTLLEDSPFVSQGDDGSCSYLWPLGDKHLLIFFSHRIGTQHMLGTYDQATKKFKPEMHQFHYAGPSSSMLDPENEGAILVINNNGGVTPNAFTLPRRLTLGKHNTVNVEPAGNVASLRSDEKTFENIALQAGEERVIDGVSGDALEIKAQIDPGTASVVELGVFRSPDGTDCSIVRTTRDRTLDRDGGEGWALEISKYASPVQAGFHAGHVLGAEFFMGGNREINGEMRSNCYHIHPPFQERTVGAVLRDFSVPNAEGKTLEFFAGQREERGDGVELIVSVMEDGAGRELRREVITAAAWCKYSIPLLHCKGPAMLRIAVDARDSSGNDALYINDLCVVDEAGNRTMLTQADSAAFTDARLRDEGDAKKMTPITFLRFDGEPLDLNVFLDKSYVEAFANGRAYMPLRVAPKPEQTGISVRTDGDNAKVLSLKTWQMKSIYENPTEIE
jgi:beta-fructofuranosidase